MKFTKLLCASHGSTGAKAAENLALELCKGGGELHHLFVVPDFWRGMRGDDWLNNAATQDRYGKYVERQLATEADEVIKHLKQACQKADIKYTHDVQVGKPADCLLKASQTREFDLIVIGSPRPKNAAGLRSKINLTRLLPMLKVPIIIAPYPGV